MSDNTGVADVGSFFIAEGLLHNSGLRHNELGGGGVVASLQKS